jgi:hypothetical protein
MPDGQLQQEKPDNSDPLGMLYFVANVHFMCFCPFLRRRMGVEGFGLAGLVALIVLTVWSPFAGPLMYLWLLLWFLAVIYRRVESFRLARKGVAIHSRFAGEPWLALKMPFVKKASTATGIIEPLMCLVVGLLLLPVSERMGGFIAVGFITLLVRNGIEHAIYEKRVQRMKDAELEGRWYSDGLRGRNRNY